MIYNSAHADSVEFRICMKQYPLIGGPYEPPAELFPLGNAQDIR